MEPIINRKIVLSLNKVWQPIGIKTVKKAIIDMNGGLRGNTPPALAMNIEYAMNEDGTPDFSKLMSVYPVSWDEWIKLPVRPFDMALISARMIIRVPTVIITPNFSKMLIKSPKPSKDGIYKRDGGIDQYTGLPISRHEANVDHVIPKSKGGKNTWENLVITSKKINFAKGNKFNEEIGYKLIRKPKAPPALPISASINEVKHVDWSHFLLDNKKVNIGSV